LHFTITLSIDTFYRQVRRRATSANSSDVQAYAAA